MTCILRTVGLTKRYGGKTVVDNVDMSIQAGDIYGFLGQNGAGKTTTLRMLTGLIHPSAGEIELFGTAMQWSKGKAMARVGSIIEYPGFYLNLNAAENLEIHRRMMGMGNKTCIDEALATVGLTDAKHQKVKNFSLGMKQRLGIARALLHRPELLLLDEPTNGLDPGGIKEMRQLFLDLARRRGITFLISSHLLGEVEQLASKIGIIHGGRLLEEIGSEDLRKKTRHCLALKVTDEQKAAFILEQRLRTTDYVVSGTGGLRLYAYVDRPEQVSAALAAGGVGVREMSVSGDSLEDYFLKLTGGEKFV
ncbi:ABC transporter ATP-binding protein [Cohnella sp. JJ-181]|uniref:ABC transporter ATP-binding protein n=1 Tax=Cohnella rhizoplanae TaxID=2974897 RepID=UPI0022FF524A|nr:ABC transporter ATP-binding protein [Cohnella sp. JJ-181]CAI6084250.1 Bacitracin transport ATP-binding protein BcrA [Cohnella sp. JJ-181]